MFRFKDDFDLVFILTFFFGVFCLVLHLHYAYALHTVVVTSDTCDRPPQLFCLYGLLDTHHDLLYIRE
jgi:hypothetical protein